MYCRLDYFFFFYWYGDHRDLHGLTHSFPTRRSSDLAARSSCGEAGGRREMSGMRIVILGLSLSSSWGNGHATTWRALIRGLAREAIGRSGGGQGVEGHRQSQGEAAAAEKTAGRGGQQQQDGEIRRTSGRGACMRRCRSRW